MKKNILRIFFKPLTVINKLIKKDNSLIFFYSNLGFRDNVKAFYDYLIEKNYNEKFKIVVSVNDYECYKENAPANVSFMSNKKGIGIFMKAKYAFYCFGKYPIKPSKHQVVVNLWHGMPLKRIGNMEPGLEKTDYNYFTKIVSTSELFVPILMKSFSCAREQVIITGQPRNDELFKEDELTDQAIRKGAEKVILWLPTYRNESKTFPVPLMDEKRAAQLDHVLKENKTRIIIKIHPLQQISGKLKKYSNIEIMNQDELNASGLSVYSLLRAADGLISDYSSVYFDYMLLDRPIAFSVNDMEEYEKERGFVFENPCDYMPGDKLSEYRDVEKFVLDVIAGRDNWREARRSVNKEINRYIDGKSSDRIAEIVFGRHGQ